MSNRFSISDSEWLVFQDLFRRFDWCFSTLHQERALRDDLCRYASLLLSANEVTNLTAITDPRLVIWKHLYDSLVILHFRSLGPVLDWGTGGGLPGIPLALFRRAIGNLDPVSLLDSVKKKAALVDGFCRDLSLDSCHVYSERGESLLARKTFSSVVMRAVAPPDRAVSWMTRSAENFLFMIGPAQVQPWRDSERKAVARGFYLADIVQHVLPHDHGTRFVIHFRRK